MRKAGLLFMLIAAGLTTSCVFALGNAVREDGHGTVLKSDSGKKFKVSVDDTGNLHTTPVD